MMPTLLPPSRKGRLLRAASYAATAGIGAAVLLDPPMLHSVLGNWLTVLWALCIMTALPCVWAALTSRYRVEYTLLPFFGSALIVAVLTLWYKFGIGVPAYTLPRLLANTALVFLFAVRFEDLHRIVATKPEPPGKLWIRHSSRRSRP